MSAYVSAYVDDIRVIREENPFESMMSRFDHAARLLNLDPDLYKVLRVPNREFTVYIPVFRDSGSNEVFTGYRVQHNFARGRFSPADQALHADYPDRHYGGNDPLV